VVRLNELSAVTGLLKGMALSTPTKRKARLATLREAISRLAHYRHRAEFADRAERTKSAMPGIALAQATLYARRFFAKRGDHAEAHLSEAELTSALSAAFELGYERGWVDGAELADADSAGDAR